MSPFSDLGSVHRLVTVFTCLGVDIFCSANAQLSYQGLNIGPHHMLLWASDSSLKSLFGSAISVLALTSCTIPAGLRGPNRSALTTAWRHLAFQSNADVDFHWSR